MDSPESAPRPSRRRLLLPLTGGVVIVVILILGLVLPGPEPDSGSRICRESVIGPLGAALTGPPGPWPGSWAALLAAPSSRPLGLEGTMALRCPEDPQAGDPLAAPSFVLISGLDRDMPPVLVACHERACFHIRSGRGNVSYAQLWFVTLGGTIDYFAVQVTPLEDGTQARRRVEQSLAALVGRDRRGLAVAAERGAVTAGDPQAIGVVTDALRSDDHRVRQCAAWTAGAAGHPALTAPLRDALDRDPEIEVREEIARSLAKLGDPAGVPVLLAAFAGTADVPRGHGPGEPAAPRERRARAHAGLVALAGRDVGGLFDGPAAVAAWREWAKR